jgi:hypothetical protein
MKYYIANDLGCVFRRSNDSTIRELEFAPLLDNNTFDTEDFGYVEPDLVGEEEVTFLGVDTTLYKVWQMVDERLGA